MNIFENYRRIMHKEISIKDSSTQPHHPASSTSYINPKDLKKLICRLVEVAKNSLVPRSYITLYNLSDIQNFATAIDGKKLPIVHESVAAHTNLFAALVDQALAYIYGCDFGEPDGEYQRTTDGYSYREIMEAIRLHDLPENDIGDIPDNGSSDESAKDILETEYYSNKIYDQYPDGEVYFKNQAFKLLHSMHDQESSTGRLLHVADKTAAIFMTLTYDSLGCMPTYSLERSNIADRDLIEISLCDFEMNGNYKASEMWTIDFFHIRKINELDDSNFFTAIIVLYTLLVNGCWYDWREDDYLQNAD